MTEFQMQTPITTAATILVLLVVTAASARVWTDASGEMRVEAEYITSQFDKIWLLRSDGGVFGVAPEELSKADRDYVEEVIQKRKATKETTKNPPGRIPYGVGREVCRLKNPEIDESSGLACSRMHPGFFWTHNDSGGDGRVYLFDTEGRNFGSCQLKNVTPFDFEDMFSFQSEGKSYLVLCDVGNNGRAAAIQLLYVIEEPTFDPKKGVTVDHVSVVQTIAYSYEDDHRDCEAVGIDPTDKTILMITKERQSECYVYALGWPKPSPTKAFPARHIGTLKIPAVTAMDVSPDGRRAVVLTYRDAYEYIRGANESWKDTFSRQPRKIVAPERVQGESICYGADGKTLYMTSEKLPTPLLMVPVVK